MKRAGYAQTFTVVGTHDFPLDMLRYDRCWPADELSVDAMVQSMGNRRLREVRLVRFVLAPEFGPTTERWRSFGWDVVPGSVKAVR